jgi:Flp pilus assembly protein TadG
MRNLFKLKNHQSQKGAAAVEFAIVLPILLILLAGIIEFGFLLYNQQVLTTAAREGSRALANPANTQSAESIVIAYCSERLITFGSNDDPSTDIVEVDIVVDGNIVAKDITVNVTYEYGFLIPGIFSLYGLDFGTSYELSANATMRKRLTN